MLKPFDEKYPEAKIINACDMTISIEGIIAESYGYNRENWIPVYYGLNHFEWYDSIYFNCTFSTVGESLLTLVFNS